MPIIKRPNHLIVSDTKYITMVAFRDGPEPDSPDREWYLAVNMSGAEIEFVASEGFKGYMVSEKEALERITEFEQNMRAEKQDYVQHIVKNLLDKVS